MTVHTTQVHHHTRLACPCCPCVLKFSYVTYCYEPYIHSTHGLDCAMRWHTYLIGHVNLTNECRGVLLVPNAHLS